MKTNPFHDLYLSEAISEDALVEVFSPLIVGYAGAVFESGNVVIRGLQGTGKTMLLNLLRPESRIAYAKAGVDFPVPNEKSKFIGAGINLRKCGALEFAQHLEQGGSPRAVQELELLFADFFNYWVVADLISSLVSFKECGNTDLIKSIGLDLDDASLNEFASSLSKDGCWFGSLGECSSLVDLRAALARRSDWYRKFLNLNIEKLPDEILTTKTVIGDPILKAAEHLRLAGVIQSDTKIFVRIDQYEQLTTLNVVGTMYGSRCQELIHKAIGARDGRVSYRIGTRAYGWPNPPVIYSTTDALELKRDYVVLNMDEMFRRRENSKTWVFPAFARDIVRRRLKTSEYATPNRQTDLSTSAVLAQSPKPVERASRYVMTKIGRKELIRKELQSLPSDVPDEWLSYIENLSDVDILSAWLSCAWIRQKMSPKKRIRALGEIPVQGLLPWSNKPYWYKERWQHALMQIASANRQALAWSGEEDVLNLSGGQILVFLFIMQHIWDAWLRVERGTDSSMLRFPIDHDVQSQGVLEASLEWRSKQIEGINSKQRRQFVDSVGKRMFSQLMADKAMSYPGANGFSINNDELEACSDVNYFLCEAVGFGDLYRSPHTSKKQGERRTKFYLAPILSPYFRIPSIHTKEPEYVDTTKVRAWMTEHGVGAISPLSENKITAQVSLWDEDAQ